MVNYYCSKCSAFFPVRGFVDKRLIKDDKKAFCPRCNSNEFTSKNRPSVRIMKKQNSLDDAPTDAQLSYIKSLGGLPSKPKNKGEAGEYITLLKKLKKKG